ncbi:metallophosphoesterase family protein [Photobacterium ganghwense]|uniref:metallophosphoesterase family protein n=1 Tax=Photobacterium ganghwense TaxID=320778 RepID=UPI001A8E89EC|nr:metallophosphoesterase [Photobacterium ganghwense]QSV17139.1 metallophosphoesterase family protein [Photobacterium ganghwense]
MFGIISDTHYHAFTQFAKTSAAGENSRLAEQLSATIEAAKLMKKAGCDRLYHAGDMFHVRGNVSPLVLNRVIECYSKIINEVGLEVRILAGNHDLETKESVFYASTSSALQSIGAEIVCGSTPKFFHDDKVMMLSWHDNSAELLSKLKKAKSELDEDACNWNAIIHAPVNGVIMGLPDVGIDAGELAEIGFGKVFSGHYHNHKRMNDTVISVGALTHHNWGDIGSLAGCVIVGGTGITHFETSAPKFLDLADCDEREIAGNYVRAKGTVESDEEALLRRKSLEALGAKGIVCSFVKSTTVVKSSSETSKIDSLRDSVGAYCKSYAVTGGVDEKRLFGVCEDILTEAEGLA